MVFKEWMRIAGNHRLSQSAQEFFIAVDEFFPFFFVCCDMDRLVAVDCQTFQILRTLDPADAAAGMALGIDDDGHRKKIFACRSDDCDGSGRRSFLID